MALASLSKSLLSKMSLSAPSDDSPGPTSINSSEPIDVVGSNSGTADADKGPGTEELENSSLILGSFSPIRTMELYPPRAKIIEDGCTCTDVPFHLLSGESVEYLASLEGADLVCLTNYRLLATRSDYIYSVPIGLLEGMEMQTNREVATFLCRDARIFKLAFPSYVKVRSFYSHFQSLVREPISDHRNLFAFVFHASLRDMKMDQESDRQATVRPATSRTGYFREELVTTEYRRMGLGPAIPDSHSSGRLWRITNCNSKYEVCATYPKLLIVPNSIPDQEVVAAAKFRVLGRLPVVTWRHQGNGCVIARSSQPSVGVFNWRSPEDEKLLQAISRACSCSAHTGTYTHREGDQIASSDLNSPSTAECPGNGHICTKPPQLVVMDLRSYTVTLGNRAKGGGSECVDYYPNCEIRFMGLPNIHAVRKSFQQLRSVLAINDQVSFLSSLEGTLWLSYLCDLLSVSCEVVEVLHDNCQPVLVHCSDGWDRTTQVVALAQLMLDSYYRTIKGFQVLVEREWLLHGHKFGDRCGHSCDDGNQRCPVFVQWLDCIHQIMRQFPCHFQFNEHFLVKLGQHAYSGLFGTFLGNSMKEREAWRVEEQTTSIWTFLNLDNSDTLNYLYKPASEGDSEVLRPIVQLQRMFVWRAMYCAPVMTANTTVVNKQPLVTSSPEGTIVQETSTLSSEDKSRNNGRHQAVKGVEEGGDAVKKSTATHSLNRDHLTPESHEEGTSTTEEGTSTIEEDLVGMEDIKPVEMSPSSKVLSGSVDEDSSTNLSSKDFHEHLHRLSQSSCPSSHVSDPIDIPASSDSHTRSVSSGNGRIPSLSDAPHECSDEHFALTPQTHPPAASIEMRPMKKTSFTESDHTASGVKGDYQSSISSCRYCLDVDGLPLNDDIVQTRLQEIMWKHREEVLRLQQQVAEVRNTGHCTKVDVQLLQEELAEQPSEKESPSSLVSWDCVDENGEGVRWIPDHAVTHCGGCGNAFWTANRKHHCRSCGNVFCGSCSDYYCPVPAEQLFSDVRVCEKCFYKLDGHLRKKVVNLTST